MDLLKNDIAKFTALCAIGHTCSLHQNVETIVTNVTEIIKGLNRSRCGVVDKSLAL